MHQHSSAAATSQCVQWCKGLEKSTTRPLRCPATDPMGSQVVPKAHPRGPKAHPGTAFESSNNVSTYGNCFLWRLRWFKRGLGEGLREDLGWILGSLGDPWGSLGFFWNQSESMLEPFCNLIFYEFYSIKTMISVILRGEETCNVRVKGARAGAARPRGP